MPLGVKAHEISIGELFAPGRHMAMPLYQRSYSWGEDEALELLSDLLDAFHAETSYFLGAAVFVESPNGGPEEIVDGQQRLTTLTMLFACLRDLEPDKQQADKIHDMVGDRIVSEDDALQKMHWRVSLNHPDEAFFRETVQTPGATRTPHDEETSGSQGRIVASTSILMKKLRPIGDQERRDFFDWLSSDVAFVRVMVADRAEGYKVFRVLNTRGKKPSTHDIIKSDLFEKAGFSLKEADAQSRLWTDHEARLGGQTFDDLLRQIRVIYDRSQKGDVLTGFRRAIVSRLNINQFLSETLPAYVQAQSEIRIGKVELGEHADLINDRFNRMRSLDHKTWLAPALKFLVTHRMTNGACGDPLAFFINLERLAFAMQILGVERVPRNKRYRRLMDAIDTNKWTYPGDMVQFEGGVSFTPFGGSPFLLSRDECRKIRLNLAHRTTTFSKRRSLALRLNSCLNGGRTVAPEIDATVEHVFPRKPDSESRWMTIWPNPRDRQDLPDTIGNFTLLPHALNQLADRLDFDEKRALSNNQGRGVDFALTEDIMNEDLWTPDTVRRRTERLIDILCADWGIP